MKRTQKEEQLWTATFETSYKSYYQEIALELLIKRWQLLDEITKIVVALTTTGSAVSGWALWDEPNYKILWAIMAGIATLLSITHYSLGIPNRLKDWSEVKTHFALLRTDLETFRHKIKMNTNLQVVDELDREFLTYRQNYRDGVQRLKSDILRSLALEKKAQDIVNNRLEGEIIIEKQ